MPVNTRNRRYLGANESRLRNEITHVEQVPNEQPVVEIRAPENRNVARNSVDIGDVPIPNDPNGLPLETAPTLTLLQQHMDVSELREMVLKLSDNQASMMDYLQSLIEPHPEESLDSLQY
jgi:hypothetical protein